MRYAEWDIARLVFSFKNGDLSLCKKRGICLLDKDILVDVCEEVANCDGRRRIG
jgi:hypothetical protein